MRELLCYNNQVHKLRKTIENYILEKNISKEDINK